MAERKMTAKGFLAKTNQKAAASASGFLAAYREYLLTGEVAYATADIVAKVDSKELMPTPALDEIKRVVLAHVLEIDRIKAEEAIERANNPQSNSNKPFEARILDAAAGSSVCTRIKEDGTSEKLIKKFDKPQDAERWVDRRLFDGAPSWYGVVTHRSAEWDVIERDTSIGRILKRPQGLVTKSNKFGSGGLGFGVKVHEKPVKFSRG